MVFLKLDDDPRRAPAELAQREQDDWIAYLNELLSLRVCTGLTTSSPWVTQSARACARTAGARTRGDPARAAQTQVTGGVRLLLR